MKKTFLTFAAAAVVAFGTTSAHAVSYDFNIPKNLEQIVDDGTDLQGILGATAVPTSVLVAGFSYVGGAAAPSANKAYLDGPSGGDGGIGVCSNSINPLPSVGKNQCNPSSDDNVTAAEVLAVSFGQDSTLNSLSFLGSPLVGPGNTHAVLANGSLLFSTTGALGSWSQILTDANGVWNAGALALNTGIVFLTTDVFQFYLTAANVDGGGNNNVPPSVPLPAGGLLLLSGLAGLGIARRRRNK